MFWVGVQWSYAGVANVAAQKRAENRVQNQADAQSASSLEQPGNKLMAMIPNAEARAKSSGLASGRRSDE